MKDILNERIKERRNELGLTLVELAGKIGVKDATVQRYESGEIKNIKRSTVAKLAEALDTTPAFLMGWEPKDNAVASDIKAVLIMQNIDDAIKYQESHTYTIHGSEGKGTVVTSNIPKDKYLLVGEGDIFELTKKEYGALKGVLGAMNSSFDDK